MGTEVQTDDAALKARHRTMWGLGDYDAVAEQVIPALGRRVAQASGAGPGDRVLDVAAGSGNASIPAAQAGAQVIASDLTPALLEAGKRHAQERGVELSWEEADAEALPYDDASFDRVISCVGVMFAPHHQRAADELVRVLRPGGTLALLSWTPDGFVGRMFATMKPFLPPPPPGASPPPLWGHEPHVRELLGDRVTDLQAHVEQAHVDCFADASDFLGFFKRCYGPTVVAYRGLADQPEREAELDEALLALGRDHDLGDGAMDWDYLLVTARRA